MNDHAESPSMPETDATTLEPAAIKPRRRRAAPVVEQTDADMMTEASTTVEAAPKARRRPARADAEAAAAGATPAATEGVLLDAPTVAAPPSPAVEAAGPSVADPPSTTTIAAMQEPAGDVGPAHARVDDAANEGSRSGRGRRRGRRDRNREQDEHPDAPGQSDHSGIAADDASGADDADESADTVDAPAAPPLPKVEVGVVFADVLSGAFDIATETAAEAAPPPRRVLPPDADAPKLHKVLAQAGIGSRRDMEELILDGQITVNGEPAHIGQRISFGDQVKVSGKPVRLRIVPPPPRLIAYHKPAGEIVTHDDPQHRPTVFRRLPRLHQGKWQSVGRLDINTEGLLLFTNSGGLANQLMHPRFGVEREYAVRVLGTLTSDNREELLDGVEIEGQEMAFQSIEEGGGDGANRWYRVVITEGRNREVRKLFDAVGLTVSRLIRIRYGSVVLPPGLKRGVWVDLDADDVRAIRRLAGGDAAQHDAHQGGRGSERGARNNRGSRGERQDGRPDERQRGNAPRARPEGRDVQAGEERGRPDDRDPDDLDINDGPIPNPLEQTFDKRFVQNPRSPAGGRGFGRGGGGFGQGGSAPPAQNRGDGPRQPDPLQTSVGYIGADAYHRKGKGGGGGGGGRGGNRGGSGGGFAGGGGGGFSGGGRRGR